MQLTSIYSQMNQVLQCKTVSVILWGEEIFFLPTETEYISASKQSWRKLTEYQTDFSKRRHTIHSQAVSSINRKSL